MNKFVTSLLLFLIISSSVTFPVLAAEQLGTTNQEVSLGNWLNSLLSKLFGWEAGETQDTKAIQYQSDPSSEPLFDSFSSLELAALEYAENMDSKTYRVEFLKASESFTSSSEEFITNLEKSTSPVAGELKLKLGEFSNNVQAIHQKAESNKITKDDLTSLAEEISTTTGRRYEKVDFDTYEEREIHPRVLGAGGEVLVAGGQLTLPASVDSPNPLPEDYEASIDAPITPEIQALADRLDNDPAKIHWWVRENIRYEPYYGAMQGAEQTLVSRMGNDIDTASLLISLLRASGYPSRYVYGEATAPREEVFNLLGVDSVQEALRIMWGAGIPAEFDGHGFVIERVWVETYTEPRPYLEGHWVQLDASWMPAENYTKIGEYVSVTSTINATELQEGALAEATINETAGYVTDINTSFIDSYTSSHVTTEVLQNITEGFFIPEEKMPPEEVYLPLSMQFDFNKSYEYSVLPDALKYQITMDVDSSDGNVLHYTNALPQISGKPFVLDFTPATPTDEAKIEAGDPAYEIRVTPKLYLGDDFTTGTDTMYGSELNITLEVSLVETTTVEKKIYAVERTAIVMDAPRTEYLVYNETFERVKALQETEDNETLARESLYLIGSNFFLSSDFYTDTLADSYNTRWTRVRPGMVFVTKESKVEHFEGVPIVVSNGGTSVDLKHDQVALSAGKNKTVEFNLRRGLTVSGYEGSALKSFYEGVTGISTIEILNRAIADGVPVYFLTQNSLERLDYLSIPNSDKEVIRELLLSSSSYFAIVPARGIQIGNWNGVGYAIIDPETGAGKYLLSGGLAGGATDKITEYIKKLICIDLKIGEFIFDELQNIFIALSTACTVYLKTAKTPLPRVIAACSVVVFVTVEGYGRLPHWADQAILPWLAEQKQWACGEE